MRNTLTGSGLACSIAFALLATPQPVRAVDGADCCWLSSGGPEAESAAAPPTYYETLMAEGAQSGGYGLPTSLYITESPATAQYVQEVVDEDTSRWLVAIRDLQRRHEQVDTVYQMILVLPLPDAENGNGFKPLQWGIRPREGTAEASVPLIYGGERVVLKRSAVLERILLPSITGGGADTLPELAGTGFRYTLWGTIVRHDPDFGESVELLANFRFQSGASAVAPDGDDERLKAYVITWIPSLDPSIPPFAVRLDIVAAAE